MIEKIKKLRYKDRLIIYILASEIVGTLAGLIIGLIVY